jgi:hypothetical protein
MDEASASSPQRPPPRSPPSRKPPRPGFTLATIAFVLAILSPVPCCPLVGFVSMPLAVAAIWRLRDIDDRRARSLARAALVLSLVGLVVQAVTYESLSNWLRRELDRSMSDSIRAAFANDYAKCVVAVPANPFAPVTRPAPTAEQLARFAEEAGRRYGSLQEVSFVSQEGDGGIFNTALTSAITLKFERRETTGSAVFQLVPRSDDMVPATRMIELTVDDAALGDLVLAPALARTP